MSDLPDEEANDGHSPAETSLSRALGSFLDVLIRRGREELGKVATEGRGRLELHQLKRDRDQMYQKLGREIATLVEGGEVDHPGLVRGVERIRTLEADIERFVVESVTGEE